MSTFHRFKEALLQCPKNTTKERASSQLYGMDSSFPSKLDTSFHGRPTSHRRIRSTGPYHSITNCTKKSKAEYIKRTKSHTNSGDFTKRSSSKPPLKKEHLGRSTGGSVVLSSTLYISSKGLPPNHQRTKSTGFNLIFWCTHNLQHKEYFVKDRYGDLIECIALRKLVYGEDHPKVALIHKSIRNCYNKRKEFEKSMTSYRHFLLRLPPKHCVNPQKIGNVHCHLEKKPILS